MKKLLVVFVCGLVLIGGCKRNGTPAAEKETSSDSQETAKQKEIEMLLPAQKHIGLVVAPAGVVQLSEYFRATGTVQPIDNRVGEVSPLARGRVLEVKAKVGDRVRAGETLAVFDNLEAVDLAAQEQSARAELARLNAQLIPATRQAERARRLADIGAGAEKDYEFSKAEEQGDRAGIKSQEAVINGLQQRLRRYGATGGGSSTVLRAPFAGVVTKAAASPGDIVEPGREMFTVADLTKVWVQAEVYEKDLGRIRIGQDAAIRVDTYADESFPGRVAYISDVLDPQTRTAKVRCEVTNKDMRLKTDMFANIELPTKFSKQALAVPSTALQDVEGKNVVFVQHSATKFEARQVEKGVTINGQTEIVSGLSAGERVVTQGAFHLKSIVAGGELGDD
ncbi:efflux RND transporter periplasmic adaptor subunit [Terriglobus aquaticus]|uniref:Efflux RND transporter periplasmic adaptor subunit n=1 Tax=Terriglobus aquaticus TaxID=940139 RepID=A0ABW9KPU5_9BACT